MEKRIKERAKKALKELEISVNELANFRQLTRSTINDQFNGNSKIGAAALEALLAYCPQLSAEWLLRGAGDMLISSIVPTEGTPRDDRETTDTTTEDSSDIAAAHIEKIEQLQAELEQQKEFNALQKEYVINLKERIAEYQDRVAELKEIIHELKKAQHTVTVPHAKSV